MRRLTRKQIMMLHAAVVETSGGSKDIRDEGLLDSAVNAPFQTFDNQELYPSIHQKAARLAYGLVNNHPFVDGNKRIGAHAMLVFLSLNGIELNYSQDELATLFLQLASGQADDSTLLGWILAHELQS